MTVIEERSKNIKVRTTSTSGGVIWTAGWIFTIAFARLIWWKALLALVIWPWYLALRMR